ncbi:MAG: hypothetical protein Tsb009_34630 [Planctomycetaceae bacterium]
MSPKSQYTSEEWERRQKKIHDALLRARERARERAIQAGTSLIYMQDGKIVREKMTKSNHSE